MPQPALILAGGLALSAGVALGAIGHAASRRSVSAGARVAARAAAAWWYSAGAFLLGEGVANLLGGFGVRDVALFVTLRDVSVLVMCLALASLTVYLAYLVLGHARALPAIALGYAALAFVVLDLASASEPIGVETSGWSAEIAYAVPFEGPLLLAAFGLAFTAPAVLALALLTRAREGLTRPERARVSALSFGVFAFAGTGGVFALGATGWSDLAAGGFASLVVALGVLIALRRRRAAKGEAP